MMSGAVIERSASAGRNLAQRHCWCHARSNDVGQQTILAHLAQNPRLRVLPALAETLPSVTAGATLEAMMWASKPYRLIWLKTAIASSARAGRNLAQRHCSCHG